MIEEKHLFKEGEKMETPQELINSTLEKVESILKENFPDYLSFGDGKYTISRGSSQVMIIIRPFTENESCIEIMSNVVTGAFIDWNIMYYLLRKNAELHFGGFGLLFDKTIIFQYSIAGSNVDANELITAINAVAIISDYYDDEIAQMTGGKRAIDMNDDVDNIQ
jgi:hypothetical protein